MSFKLVFKAKNGITCMFVEIKSKSGRFIKMEFATYALLHRNSFCP